MQATTVLFILGLIIPFISSKASPGGANDLVNVKTEPLKKKEKSNNKLKEKLKEKANQDGGSVTLYSESKYDWEYLQDYKGMIQSLIGTLGSSVVQVVNRDLKRRSGEERTPSELYGQFNNHASECSKLGLHRMTTVKVIQDEDSNYVMLKEDKQTGKLYVEKSTNSQKSFDYELEFFSKLDKNNRYFPVLTCYMNTPGKPGRLSVVTEFIAGKDSHLLAARANKSQLKSMVKQLFEAVVDLHRMGYIHADIKPGNVLVTDDFQVKLIDFGMATRVGQAKKYRGSPYTRAPELHDKTPGPVDVAIDWWAFGATVAIWYYYYYNNSHHHLKNCEALQVQNELMTAERAKEYLQVTSSYDFTPFKWTGGSFRAGHFPSSFEADIRAFLVPFLSIDPELRTFDTVRLQDFVRNHPYFHE